MNDRMEKVCSFATLQPACSWPGFGDTSLQGKCRA
jgi:hypothetical protein